MAVRAGQIYIACNPRQPTHLRVDRIYEGRALVTDPSSLHARYRLRWIKLSSLHETGQTRNGIPRRTGYRLHSQPPQLGQILCLRCCRYVDREQLHETRLGVTEPTCKPCADDIAALVATWTTSNDEEIGYRDDVRDVLTAQGWTENSEGALIKNGALWTEANDCLDSGVVGPGQDYSVAFDSGVPARVITAACEAAATEQAGA
ncbi:hypothetical protein [Streptomyces sp. H27-D2]|uniref:hypothetical protein n=1 Tax=Streptomyces sp. H27-D2 TaxID=3046304 RepID=UPI002DB570F9|nr:hypothetical protein [Streptomyces sp. H27-D2]MEC4016124.1 hypothetical protein [Streptomyces sp. H27-D2]